MVTLKYMNPLLYKEIHFQSVKYIINEQSMNINVFLLFCSFVFLQIERERERERYIKLSTRRNSPKVTYLIFRRGSTGESFFFHGLIDFMLFLTLAWRTWVPRVQDMFLSSSPGVMAMGLSATSPAQKLTFLFFLTRRRCHFRFRVPANHLASPSFPLVSGDLRLLSTNICWYPLCDLHSFLTVNLWRLASSFQREDSINLISIVSVGYHVTFCFRFVVWWCINFGMPKPYL